MATWIYFCKLITMRGSPNVRGQIRQHLYKTSETQIKWRSWPGNIALISGPVIRPPSLIAPLRDRRASSFGRYPPFPWSVTSPTGHPHLIQVPMNLTRQDHSSDQYRAKVLDRERSFDLLCASRRHMNTLAHPYTLPTLGTAVQVVFSLYQPLSVVAHGASNGELQ